MLKLSHIAKTVFRRKRINFGYLYLRRLCTLSPALVILLAIFKHKKAET